PISLIEPERVEPPSFQVLSGVRQSGFGFLRTRLVSWRLRHSRVPDHDPKRTVVPQHSPSFIEHLIEREDIVIDALLQSYLAFHLVITLAKLGRRSYDHVDALRRQIPHDHSSLARDDCHHF